MKFKFIILKENLGRVLSLMDSTITLTRKFINAGIWSKQVNTKYVVKHKSAKLLMTYAVGKLEATLNISHFILSTSNQRVSYIELVS